MQGNHQVAVLVRMLEIEEARCCCCILRSEGCRHDKPVAFRLLCTSPSFRTSSRAMQWAIKTMVDDSTDQSGHSTRLFSAIQSFWNKLSGKLKKVRKGLPVKILFFLIGFYCATAFATVIGQTGDWDILSAGLAVAIVEGIGALMYRASSFVCISW